MVKTMHAPKDIGGNGTVLRWMKKEGEKFQKGEPLFEAETRKAIVQVDAPEAGTILRISAKEGTAVIGGSAVALYAVVGEPVPPELLKPPSPATLLIKLLDEENKLVTAASVTIEEQEMELTADGAFTISGLSANAYTVMVKAPGFLEKIFVLSLREGETASHELNLHSIERLGRQS